MGRFFPALLCFILGIGMAKTSPPGMSPFTPRTASPGLSIPCIDREGTGGLFSYFQNETAIANLKRNYCCVSFVQFYKKNFYKTVR